MTWKTVSCIVVKSKPEFSGDIMSENDLGYVFDLIFKWENKGKKILNKNSTFSFG